MEYFTLFLFVVVITAVNIIFSLVLERFRRVFVFIPAFIVLSFAAYLFLSSRQIDDLAALAFLLFDPNIALYTLLMFVVVNMVVDQVHTAYKRVRLEIVTSNGEEVKQELISHYIRGITLVDGIGAYTGSKRTVLLMVTQAHEVYDVQKTILTIDPDAFISMTPVRLLAGKFNRVVIK
jgi:uncharacterized membrane-anchored protein YitT (DUF2179 family)